MKKDNERYGQKGITKKFQGETGGMGRKEGGIEEELERKWEGSGEMEGRDGAYLASNG